MFTLLLRRFRGISKLKRKTSRLRPLKQLAMIGILVLGAHVIAMMAFEGLDLWTAIWLTTTTTTTVGYGDISAASWQGQLSTMVLIYGGGVFIVAQGAGLFFEHRSERARLKQLGEWIWNMSEHIIVINTPCHNRTRFMERVFDEFEASKPRAHAHQDFLVESKHLEFLLITEGYPEGLPRGLEDRNVKLQAGRGDDPEVLEDANIREALVNDDPTTVSVFIITAKGGETRPSFSVMCSATIRPSLASSACRRRMKLSQSYCDRRRRNRTTSITS